MISPSTLATVRSSCRLEGWGTALPARSVTFGNQRRFRITGGEDQLSLASQAALAALETADLGIDDIDCIIAACAVGNQPIPCTAALIHERIALGTDIPALDLNTTCTSFITAVDMASYLIDAGRYRRVLIVSAEAGSPGLNPEQKESFELFSDAAAAVVLGHTDSSSLGVLAADQRTWSEGAHSTEIRGGLTRTHASARTEHNAADFLFDMQGRQVLLQAARKLPGMAQDFQAQTGVSVSEGYDMIVPHQASAALPMMMDRMGIGPEKYANRVTEYGNMIAASIPYTLCKLLDEGRLSVSRGQEAGSRVLLFGTAAGLTANMLAWQL